MALIHDNSTLAMGRFEDTSLYRLEYSTFGLHENLVVGISYLFLSLHIYFLSLLI
jgi:hypothetical protein